MNRLSSSVLGIISDTHYWQRAEPVVTKEGAIQLQRWSEILLATLLDEMASAGVTQIVHLGDVTCGGGTYDMPTADFVDTLASLCRRFQESPIPVAMIPGNHDSWPGTGTMDAFSRIWAMPPGTGTTIDLPEARLVLLNSQGHPAEILAATPGGDPVFGWVNDAELARLDEALATAGERPVLIFCHQLLHPWAGDREWRDFYGIANAAGVLEIIRRHGNTRAVFQGHAHRLDIQEVALTAQRKTLFAVVPAIIEYPVAWMRLELSNDRAAMSLQRLPLPELAEMSRDSGSGQRWREGKPEWWNVSFPLR